MPFAVLVATMSCYLNLSRRLELVVARSAGLSAWQFIMPAVLVAFLLGVAATTLYNPISAALREQSKRLEAELFGNRKADRQEGFWVRQRSIDGQAIINAASSRNQGATLDGITVFAFDDGGRFQQRIEAKSAELESGHWQLREARVYAVGAPVREVQTFLLATNLTREQVRESFATPETLSFWQLPKYIETAEQAGFMAAGYRLQYQLLIARPFLLAAMVMLAGSVSLRFFRFGGVTRLVLGGIAAGFLLYVISKVTEDVSKAELMHPVPAAWFPVLIGALTGIVVLLFQEDG
jgi:lipopolysaccharide export system permease protein